MEGGDDVPYDRPSYTSNGTMHMSVGFFLGFGLMTYSRLQIQIRSTAGSGLIKNSTKS